MLERYELQFDWDKIAYMKKDNDGDYVLYKDHKKLQLECDTKDISLERARMITFNLTRVLKEDR